MAHTEHHGAHGAPSDAAVGHELSDADLGGVGKTLLFTGIFIAICFVFVWFMYGFMRSEPVSGDRGLSPAVPRPGDRRPPLPRLQVTPADELATFRRLQQETLDTWEWSDSRHATARIPVSRAIEIAVERGLPVPTPVAAPAAPAATPGAAPPGGTSTVPASPAAAVPAAH